MTDFAERGRQFRVLHEGPEPFILGNVWDPGGARILAGLGFKAVATTSAGFAFSRGRLDGAIGLDEVLDHAADLVTAVDIPVSADLEAGHAENAEGVGETIRRAAEVGLVGATIEDTTGDPADPIFPLEVAVERAKAAIAAARAAPHDFLLTARSENFLHGRPDLSDTIARLQAFEAAGADVLYAPGLPDLEAIRQVCAAATRPVNVVVGIGPLRASVAEYADAGVRRISLGGSTARHAFGSLLSAGEEMMSAGTFNYLDNAAALPALARFMRD